MSQRYIDENLEYHITNMGEIRTAPRFEFHADEADTTTTPQVLIGTTNGWTIQNVAVTTGTVTSSLTIDVGAAPTRSLQTYWPRVATFVKNGVAAVANTPLDIDWSGATGSTTTIGLAPAPTLSAVSDYISQVGGATTQWQFNSRGHWGWRISLVPTVALSDSNTVTLKSQYSSNSGGAYAPNATWYAIKGAAGTPAVDHIGGTMVFEYPFNALGTERVKFTVTCTENKTFNCTVAWWMLKPL
jgi:hypothetical protein